MRAVAVWLAGRLAAAAQRKDALMRIAIAIGINEIKFSGHVEGAGIHHTDFCSGHDLSLK